jgi:hypothetical protein
MQSTPFFNVGALNRPEHDLIPLDLGTHPRPFGDIAFQYLHRQRIFNILLNDTFQGSGAINRVIALFGNQLFRFIRQNKLDMPVGKPCAEPFNLNIHDVNDFFGRQVLENDDFIDSI